MYGRMIDGKLEYAPKNVIYGDKLICNPKKSILLELGYLPIVRTEEEKKEGYISIPYWEQEDQIVQKWKFEKIVEGITIEDRMNALEDAFSEFVSEVLSDG